MEVLVNTSELSPLPHLLLNTFSWMNGCYTFFFFVTSVTFAYEKEKLGGMHNI